MSESEAQQIEYGLEQWDESPWEWGVYVERNDGWGGEDSWAPLVYGGERSYEEALETYRSFRRAASAFPNGHRRPRIVRRAVSPWEVRG